MVILINSRSFKPRKIKPNTFCFKEFEPDFHQDLKALPIVNKDIVRNFIWEQLDQANIVRFPR